MQIVIEITIYKTGDELLGEPISGNMIVSELPEKKGSLLLYALIEPSIKAAAIDVIDIAKGRIRESLHEKDEGDER